MMTLVPITMSIGAGVEIISPGVKLHQIHVSNPSLTTQASCELWVTPPQRPEYLLFTAWVNPSSNHGHFWHQSSQPVIQEGSRIRCTLSANIVAERYPIPKPAIAFSLKDTEKIIRWVRRHSLGSWKLDSYACPYGLSIGDFNRICEKVGLTPDEVARRAGIL